MRELQIILYLLMAIYSFYILGSHFFSERKSRQKLKNNYKNSKDKNVNIPTNLKKTNVNSTNTVPSTLKSSAGVRSLTNKECDYVMPYCTIHGLTLASREVFTLENVTVSFEGYKIKGNTVLKMRADGIEMIFPYVLEEVLDDNNESNDIEYAILNSGDTPCIAIAVNVNGLSIAEIGDTIWEERREGKSIERVLSTRDENRFEYRLRQKKVNYAWVYFWATIAFAFLCFATCVESISPLLVHLGMASFLTVISLFVLFRARHKNRRLQSVKLVEGVWTNLNYRDLHNANNIHIRSFIGFNYPLETIDEKMINDKAADELGRVKAELQYNPQKKLYSVLSSSFTHSAKLLHQSQSLRPHKRFLLGSLLCVIFSVILFFCLPIQNIHSLFTYALDYVAYDSKTYQNDSALLAANISRGDIVDIPRLRNVEPEVLFTDNKVPLINHDAMRWGASESLNIPQPSDKLKKLYDYNFFTFRIKNKLINPHSIVYKVRAMERAKKQMSYAYLPTNPYKILKANLITNPHLLINLIDDICTEKKDNACSMIYKSLAQIASSDEFFYLNRMEDRYDSTLTADEFKKMLSNETIWLDQTAYNSIRSYLRNWAGNAMTAALSPEKFTNLKANRGGVILKRKNILNRSLADSRYSSENGFIAEAEFYKRSSYQVKGLVDDISTHDGVRLISLLAYDKTISQQAFATMIAFVWIILLFAFTFLSWLIPPKYPKSTSASAAVVNGDSAIR